jgi:hypothetical protein
MPEFCGPKTSRPSAVARLNPARLRQPCTNLSCKGEAKPASSRGTPPYLKKVVRQPRCIPAIAMWHVNHHDHSLLSARCNPRKPSVCPDLPHVAGRAGLPRDCHARGRCIVRHSICNRSLQPSTHHRLSIEVLTQLKICVRQLGWRHLHILQAQNKKPQFRRARRHPNNTGGFILNQLGTAAQPIQPQHLRRLLRSKPCCQIRKPRIAGVGKCALSIEHVLVSRMRAREVASRNAEVPLAHHRRPGPDSSLPQRSGQKQRLQRRSGCARQPSCFYRTHRRDQPPIVAVKHNRYCVRPRQRSVESPFCIRSTGRAGRQRGTANNRQHQGVFAAHGIHSTRRRPAPQLQR